MPTDTTPTITIAGIDFPAPSRYAAGDVLTANEAVALNQTLAENIRNGFTKAAKALSAKGASPAELMTAYHAYVASYAFTGRTRKAKLNPVLREAEKLAKLKIQEQCRAQGIDPKSFAPGKIDELVDELIAKDSYYQEEAARRISALREAARGPLLALMGAD